MLFDKLHPFYEMDGEPAGSAEISTPPISPAGPAPDGGQPTPAPGSEFAQYMGLDLTSIPAEQRPAMIERLKQVDSAFSPAMMKFKPWGELAEEGITPEQARQGLALQRIMTENPKEAMRLLQAMLPIEEPPAAAKPETDLLAPFAEAYGEEVAAPFRKIYGVAQQAQQTVAQLAQQLKERDTRDEKKALDSAVKQAETGLTDWLGKNAHFNLQADQLRAELKKVGPQGLLKGLSADDYDAAALQVLGSQKYGDAVYAQRLKAARADVDKNLPGPVVAPGAPTASQTPNNLSFDNDREVLAEAMSRVGAMARQSGG